MTSMGIEASVGSPLLDVADLRVQFSRHGAGRPVRAVDGASLVVNRGETLGLVGESGCGKTTLTRAVLGLAKPSGGSIRLDGREIAGLSRRKMRSYRPVMQVVFQDPYGSLDPRMTVHDIVAEPLRVNHRYAPSKVTELLASVGLSEDVAERHPASFSGGQRQRIGIARALALDPMLLILDEPVSALDVSIQAQVINLLKELQRRLGLTYLFIAHDLAAVRQMSQRIAVMYLGRVVETGTREQVFGAPQHPYTQSLLAAIPIADPKERTARRDRVLLGGDLPDPSNPPSGCRFRTRCPRAERRCEEAEPEMIDVTSGEGHLAACFFPGATHRYGKSVNS